MHNSNDWFLSGMPHGYCLRWDPQLVLTFVAANVGIAVAYFAIPFALRFFASQRSQLPYPYMFKLFAGFILSCGLTHLMKVLTLYYPAYWLEALLDSWTAVISLLTAALLLPLIPKALTLRSPEELAYANEQLEKSNTALEKTNHQLAIVNEQLKLARDIATSASLAKTAFVANVSHELRTPLSGILGANELLLTSVLDKDQQQMSITVDKSAKALLVIVNDLLDLSKIEAGAVNIEFRPSNLSSTVNEVVQLISKLAELKNLSVTSEVTDLPELVVCDAARIRQVLINLCNNAVKFTRSGTVHIKVDARGSSDSDLKILFEVSDTGIGISAEVLNKLFMPFVQGDMTTTKQFGGTGLGLAISKQLVELMGGSIGASSEVSIGSKFWFTIPVQRFH